MAGRMPQWKHLVATKYEAGNESPISQLMLDDLDVIDELQWLIMDTLNSEVTTVAPDMKQRSRYELHTTDEKGRFHDITVYEDLIWLNLGHDDNGDWTADPDGTAWKFLTERSAR